MLELQSSLELQRAPAIRDWELAERLSSLIGRVVKVEAESWGPTERWSTLAPRISAGTLSFIQLLGGRSISLDLGRSYEIRDWGSLEPVRLIDRVSVLQDGEWANVHWPELAVTEEAGPDGSR